MSRMQFICRKWSCHRKRSIGPLGSELWPFKEGNHYISPKIGAFVTLFVNPFANGPGPECDFSNFFCFLCTCRRKRIQVKPLWLELWPCKDGNHQTISFKFEPSGRISSIHVQTLITLAWNEIFQKFKSLASSAWCALALGTRSRTIAALGSKLWSCKEGTRQRIFDPSMFKRL